MTKMQKCSACNKKISLVETITSKCRCEKIFCNVHRIDHICSFDYKDHYKNNNTLIKVIGEKIDAIY